jgi:hypothetical protein
MLNPRRSPVGTPAVVPNKDRCFPVRTYNVCWAGLHYLKYQNNYGLHSLCVVAFGDLMVACLPLDSSSNLAEDDGFSSAINICGTISFGVGVKPKVPCHKIKRHVNPTGMKEILSRQNSAAMYSLISPASLRNVFAESCGGWSRNNWKSHGDAQWIRKWSRCMGRLVRPPHILIHSFPLYNNTSECCRVNLVS